MSPLGKYSRTLLSMALIGLANFAAATAAQAQAELIITELHYHSEVDDQEFVEIKNIGDEAQDFSDWEVGGVGVVTLPVGGEVIPAGGFLVLAENSSAFQIRYGFAPDGTYAGSLRNSGEEVELKMPTRDEMGNLILDEMNEIVFETVFSVMYWDGDDADPVEPDEEDRPNWPTDPDGRGRSLVPMIPNDNPDPNDFRNWRPSINDGGSPGTDEPLPDPLLPVFINEIRTRDGVFDNDAIEFFNPNSTDVNIGDWFLTDDVDDANGSPLPADTIVPAGGFLVVANGDNLFDIGLSSQGEGVFLYSGDSAGNVTGFINGFYFGASADGTTFSRFINSVGVEQFPASEETLTMMNAAPNVGPVVITELMYNPTTNNGDDEYIEIQNISNTTVSLFDPANPGNNWRVEGINFILNGVQPTLAPGEIALITQTDEATFRTDHPGIPAGIQFFGPFSGSLSNGGEEVALQRPENLDDVDLTQISYINVDVVQYDNSSPWPTEADAGGHSLVRIDPEAYGNDPANWQASLLPNGSAGIIFDFTGPEILVNEILSHTDLPQVDVIELFNPTAEDVDIGGWFLTDDKDDPDKFAIPSGTVIPAGGFWAINQDNDANESSAPAGYFGSAFQISSRGDEIYLYSADAAGNLTGYRHGWTFRATENGATNDDTLGRYVDSFGREHLTRQLRSFEVNRFVSNPVAEVNNPPIVGPIIFTEINAEPAPGGVEFIELTNISNQTINLFDNSSGGNTANTWALDGVEFAFPGGLSFQPGVVVVILPFGTDEADFMTANNIAADDPMVVVFGGTDGYVGALNNGGEELALLRPDNPDSVNGVTIVPMIAVDIVNYGDSDFWPVAGEAATLEKTTFAGFSDDPINWSASATPGGTPGVVTEAVEFSYDVWAQDNFTAAELADPALSDCDGDVNGDGVANIYAYAFGYDPHTSPAGALLPQPSVLEGGGVRLLSIIYRQRVVAPDLIFEIESSTDLSNWSVISPLEFDARIDNGDGTETLQVIADGPAVTDPRLFMRVRITKS